MKLTINPLDPESIFKARSALKEYAKKTLPDKADKLVKKLAEYGKGQASVYFTTAVYDLHAKTHQPMEQAKIEVTMRKVGKGKARPQYVVTARGKAVAFIEFGAGVYFNGSGDPYHEERTDGIVGIGEYGKGHGKQRSWAYYTGKFRKGGGREVKITAGTPEQPGMWLAAKAMRGEIERIAKEAFA